MILHRQTRARQGAFMAFALAVVLPSDAALLPQDTLYALWANDVVVYAPIVIGVRGTIAERDRALSISPTLRINLDASCSGDTSAAAFAGAVSLPVNSFQVLGALRLDSYELFDDGTRSERIGHSPIAQCSSVDRSEAGQRTLTNADATDRQKGQSSLDPLRVELTQVDAVPEPTTSAMLAVGVAVLGLRLSRRRSRLSLCRRES